MKKSVFTFFAVFLFAFSVQAREQSRVITNFDANWSFCLGDVAGADKPDFNDQAWRRLNVPHDWSIEGENVESNPGGGTVGFFPTGIGWYRKTFTVASLQAGDRYQIEFDGVYMNSTVWLNGRLVGNYPYGYSSFVYDLTPYIVKGKNVIAVKVDNSKQPNSRWYSGSGIYRHVRLVKTHSTHFAQWSIFNYTKSVANGLAVVHIESEVVNEGKQSGKAVVKHQVLDADSKVVAETKKEVTLAGNVKESQELTIASPVLWDVDAPYLYTLRSTIIVGGKEVDCVDNVLGVRTIEFDIDKGFLLNGKRVKMKGVNLHHDAGGLGAAVPLRVWERRFVLLKESGCNAIRTSHNPPAPEFLELCDRMGFLVMDEAFDEWVHGKNKYSYQIYWKDWHVKDLTAMVQRDRNHPSVVIWSVGNEVYDQTDKIGGQVARELIGICHANDPTRLCTSGNDRIADYYGPPTPEFLAAFENDIVGYNYPDRWGPRRELYYSIDKHDFPNRRVIGTETSGYRGDRGAYNLGNDPTKVTNPSYINERMLDVAHRWKYTLLYDYVMGDFMWTGVDYYGETGWPNRGHSSGYLDLCGFKKDGFYFFKSIWTQQPTIHLLPHWNWPGREGQVIPVLCYTNCESAELFVNGKSYGKKSIEFPRQGVELGWNKYGPDKVFATTGDLHLQWDVVYEPGEIKVVGVKKGREYVDIIRTTGQPASIRLSVDRDVIKTDPEDVAHVTVEILDKDGNLVPTADNLVKFSITGGEIIGVENSKPDDLMNCKLKERKAFNGMCLAIVQAAKSGKIVVKAESEGLQPAEVSIQAENGAYKIPSQPIVSSVCRAVPDEGMEKAMEKYLQAARDQKLKIQSVMVLQHGKVLSEHWMNGGDAKKPHVLNSVSKTFTSAAVGLAIGEGLLSLDDKVVSFFPDDLPASLSDNLKKVTVRNLLTMNSGHDREPDRSKADTWAKAFLNAPIDHTPGTFYCYNSLGTYMLSAIVQKVTGQKIVDYLQPRLFDPLGIEAPHWDESPQGINCGGWGLYLKTEDLAKMGQLLLQKGKWNGKQILPQKYAIEATRKQVPCVPSWIRFDEVDKSGLTPENSDWVMGYGYQVWRCRHNAYRADGAGGQYIIVIPDKDAVVINTADLQDMQAELNLVWDYILPALK